MYSIKINKEQTPRLKLHKHEPRNEKEYKIIGRKRVDFS